MRKLHFLLLLGAGFALLFGCASQAADAPAQTAATGSAAYMSSAASGVSGNSSIQAQSLQANGTRLTLIKFHGSAQCVSCTNLGKFANSTLEKNFQEELADGSVKYLDINAETDTANPYVKKYQPTHASLYLLTEGAGGEKFEELAEAWYYAGDEAKYVQYLSSVIAGRLGG